MLDRSATYCHADLLRAIAGQGMCLTSSHPPRSCSGHDVLVPVPCVGSCAALQALRSLGVVIMTSTKVTGVTKAGAGFPASSAATAAAEAAMSATAAIAAAATAGSSTLPARPQSPEAAAVEPLAVLAAAAAASTADPSSSAAAAAGTNSSNGTSSSSSSSSEGEDATYVVQLEAAAPGAASSSSSMSADLVLWTAGARPASSPLQPFPLDTRGQLETDATLRVLKHSRVFALGDVSRGQPGSDGTSSTGSGGFYPATAQVAFQQADYAAWNIWSAINGRALLPFRWGLHGMVGQLAQLAGCWD